MVACCAQAYVPLKSLIVVQAFVPGECCLTTGDVFFMPAQGTFLIALFWYLQILAVLTKHLLEMWVWGGLLLGCFGGAWLAGSPALSRRSRLLWREHACLGSLNWRGRSCWSDLLWRSRWPLLLRWSGLGTLGLLSLRREPLLWRCVCPWRLRSLRLAWSTWKGHVGINMTQCTWWTTSKEHLYGRLGFAKGRDYAE